MKKTTLWLMVLFITQSAFTQKIILHRNTGGDQTFFLSSVDSVTFLPFACGDEIRYEGKTYGTVLIGTQCWFKENLDIGVMISGNSDQTNNSPANYIEKYCYGDIPTNCDAYGGLYQWNEAMQYVTTVGTQGICPAGWHLPTLVEFQTLAAAVGNNGNALKEIGQGVDPGEGTNTSGFSALLAGTRHYNGNFYYLGNDAVFWISTDYNVGESNYFYLPYDLSNIIFDHNSKNYGFSVRCLKDQ